MGLGKTYVGLGLVRRLKKKTLIIAPAFLCNNWRDEIAKSGIDKRYFTVVSYSKIKTIINEDFHTMIMDEAHYLKNPDSQRTTYTRDYILRKKPKYLLLMTGTPLKNDASEMFSLFQLVSAGYDLKNFKQFKNNIWRFKNYFMNASQMIISGRRVTKFKGVKNHAEFKAIREQVTLTKKVDEVLKLPDTVQKFIRQDCEVLDDKLVKAFKDKDQKAFMTVKAKAASLNVPYTIQMVEEIPAQVVVFTEHVDAATDLARKLKVPAITGKVSADKRDEIVKAFVSGETRYLVATYKTAGVGLNLVNCSHMVFNDLPFIPADLEQAKSRIRRIGAKHTCFYYYMALSSMYFRIFKALKTKQDDIRMLE